MAALTASLLALPRAAEAGNYNGPAYTGGDYSNPNNSPDNPPLPRVQDNYVSGQSGQAWGEEPEPPTASTPTPISPSTARRTAP